MHNGFVKGVVVGGVVAASVSMLMNSEMVSPRSKRRMMRSGKTFLRKSGNIIGDMADLFR